MKKSLLIYIFVFAALHLAACCNSDATNPANSIKVDCNNDGVAERGKLKEFVVGDFNGDGEIEYAALYDLVAKGKTISCYLRFGDARISEINLDWEVSHLVNEGDLNGDNGDELGFFYRGGCSYWGEYKVLTRVNDSWRELVSASHHEDWCQTPYQDLVRVNPSDANTLIVTSVEFVEDRMVDVENLVDINK